MPHRDAADVAAQEPLNDLRAQRNFRHQHEYGLSLADALGGRVHVDFSLAAASDTVEQELLEAAFEDGVREPRVGRLLLFVEHVAFFERLGRARRRHDRGHEVDAYESLFFKRFDRRLGDGRGFEQVAQRHGAARAQQRLQRAALRRRAFEPREPVAHGRTHRLVPRRHHLAHHQRPLQLAERIRLEPALAHALLERKHGIQHRTHGTQKHTRHPEAQMHEVGRERVEIVHAALDGLHLFRRHLGRFLELHDHGEDFAFAKRHRDHVARP